MSSPLIILKSVCYAYPRSSVWALNNINLEIGEGEFLAVMGENGAGKTTFCKLINGLIPHSQGGRLLGTVTVDSINTVDSSTAVLAGKVGMVFDDPETQLFTTVVRDEVAFGPENLLLSPVEIEKRVGFALEAAGLLEYADVPPAALSGGQKQRLAIAAALALANRVLVLDEPSSQLDPQGAQDLLSLIRRIRKQHRLTVIMTTHHSEEAAECADRICVLKNGTVAACDTPRAIFSNRELSLENGIRPPDVSALAHFLDERGVPLSFVPVVSDEALTAVTRWLGCV